MTGQRQALECPASWLEEYISKMVSYTDKQQIDRALTLVREILGADVIGVYLFGSAVLGGLRPESDLDILVVSKRLTTRSEKQRLVRGLLAVSGRKTSQGMWRRIDLTVVVEGDIKPWRYPPRFDFQYGDWLRSEFEIGNVEPWLTNLNPDLAVLITMVILANMPILGPPPTDIFDPMPHQDLLNAMLSDIERLRGDINSDTRNVILTLARIWSTVATGVIRSKEAAADWGLDRLPESHRPVLARARAIYLGELPERWDDIRDDIAPHVNLVIAEIQRLASPSSEHP
jgi:predicted nucleotidyltransferase